MNSYLGLTIAVSALICSVSGLSVTVTPDTDQYLKAGESLPLSCTLDMGLTFLISGNVAWYFKPAGYNTEEVQISDNGNKVIDDANYIFNFQTEGDLGLSLTVTSVTNDNNGEFICRAVHNKDETVEGKVNVVVLKRVSRVELSIDNKPGVTGQELQPYEEEVRPGKTTIKCNAYGSHPDSRATLFLGNEKLNPESAQQPFSSVTVHRRLLPIDNGKKIRCVANLDLPDNIKNPFSDRVSSIPLHIITLVPLISCTNKTASIQDKYVKLICSVSSEKPLKQIYWKIGHNNKVLFPGNKTEDFTEVRVEKIEGNAESQKVILDIYKMKEEHFNSIFYLIVEDMNGVVYKEPVFIREYVNSSNSIKPVGLALFCVVFIGLLKSWM